MVVVGVIWIHSAEQRKAALATQQRQQEQEQSEQLRKDRIDAQIDTIASSEDSTESLHYMTGAQFEAFMAEFLATQGYDVEQLGGAGDQGVDLILTQGERTIAVQLKRYTRPLGNKPVQEVLSGRFIHGTNEAWVITTSSFTRGAVEAARNTQVRLIDGRELFSWIQEASEEL
jgi:restriction system protein